MLIKLASAELWAGRRRLWLPGLSFAFSLAALSILISVEQRIAESFEQQGREILGADFEIEAFRPLLDDEWKTLVAGLGAEAEFQQSISFNTMIQGKESSVLTRLRAVESGFPFYGTYEFEPNLGFADLDDSEPRLLASSELLELLQLKVGDRVKIGETSFTIAAVLVRRPPGLSGLFRLAPPAWIHQRHLAITGLMNEPGRFEFETYIKVPGDRVDRAESFFEETALDAALRFESFKKADRGFQRMYEQVSLFAQFVAVLALLISGLSVLGSLQNWIYERRYLIASLRVFGASKRQIVLWTMYSSFIFGMVFNALGVFLGFLSDLALFPAIQSVLPIQVSPQIQWASLLACGLVGLVLILLFSALAQVGLDRFRPLMLLRAQVEESSLIKSQLLWLGIIFAFFYLLNFWILKDLIRATQLSIGSLALGGLAIGISWALLWMARSLPVFSEFSTRYAFRSLLRNRSSTLLSASLLFIVASLLACLISMQEGLRRDFEIEEGVSSTGLFLFDLGEEEAQEVKAILKDAPSIWAPWVRVRWLKKNGESVKIENKELFDPREFNISTSLRLPEGNKIVAGEFWSSSWDPKNIPEISVTREFSRQVDLELGDVMTLDLWGISFDAKVTSFRTVRWTEFQPNFRLLIQDGFFDGVPFSYVAGVMSQSQAEKTRIREEISRRLPAVSVIDVFEIKDRLVGLSSNLTNVLYAIMFFLLALSFGLVAALAQEKFLKRYREFAQLKALGADRRQIQKILILEFAAVSILPTFAGVLLGVLIGQFVLVYFFSLESVEAWSVWLVAPLLLSLLMIVVGILSTRSLAAARPQSLFAEM